MTLAGCTFAVDTPGGMEKNIFDIRTAEPRTTAELKPGCREVGLIRVYDRRLSARVEEIHIRRCSGLEANSKEKLFFRYKCSKVGRKCIFLGSERAKNKREEKVADLLVASWKYITQGIQTFIQADLPLPSAEASF